MAVIPAVGDLFRWRIPVDGVPAEELTILISQLRFDPDVRFTSEIEAGLVRSGWEFIRFRRPLTTEKLIEHGRYHYLSEIDVSVQGPSAKEACGALVEIARRRGTDL